MTNDYYDFNPSPAVWVLLLTGMILFVLAISLLLILGVDRGQATGSAPGAEAKPPTELSPANPVEAVEAAPPTVARAS